MKQQQKTPIERFVACHTMKLFKMGILIKKFFRLRVFALNYAD